MNMPKSRLYQNEVDKVSGTAYCGVDGGYRIFAKETYSFKHFKENLIAIHP